MNKITLERCWDQYYNTNVILTSGKEFADIIDRDAGKKSSQKINIYSNSTVMYSDRAIQGETPWAIHDIVELDVQHDEKKRVFEIKYEKSNPIIVSMTKLDIEWIYTNTLFLDYCKPIKQVSWVHDTDIPITSTDITQLPESSSTWEKVKDTAILTAVAQGVKIGIFALLLGVGYGLGYSWTGLTNQMLTSWKDSSTKKQETLIDTISLIKNGQQGHSQKNTENQYPDPQRIDSLLNVVIAED